MSRRRRSRHGQAAPPASVATDSRPTQPRTRQFICSCGYIARPELMDVHHLKNGMHGIHSERKPFGPPLPDER